MVSKFAISRLVARDISSRNFTSRRDQLLDWIEAQPDEGFAADALLGAMGYSKNVGQLLTEADRIYQEQTLNHEVDDSGGGGGGSSLPAGGEPSQVLAKVSGADGDCTWADPVSDVAALRAWEASTVAYLQDFSNGLPDSGWTIDPTTYAAAVATPIYPEGGANYGSSPFATYATMLQVAGQSQSPSYTLLTLDLNAIPELEGRTPTQIKYWDNIFRPGSGSTPSVGFSDGATSRDAYWPYGSNWWTGWTERTYNIGSINNDQKWNWYYDGVTVGRYYLTGIRIMAVPEPYNLNEIVVYQGAYYRSQINNNPNTPGQSPTWQQV